MYVRWQSRKRKHPNFGTWRWANDRLCQLYRHDNEEEWRQDVAWRAILVENTRVGGKPKQRHIAYLASFTESQVGAESQRIWIWQAISARLDNLSNRISATDRKRIETAIEEKIGPPPTTAQVEEAHRRVAEITAAFADLAERASIQRRAVRRSLWPDDPGAHPMS